MKPHNPTGLGEPVVSGKRSLFQPPEIPTTPVKSDQQNKIIRQKKKHPKAKVMRIRTTTELTTEAITVIQEIQQRYRLKTGKVLPVWKIISQAIEQHGRSLDTHIRG
jgi:hypothetical protein